MSDTSSVEKKNCYGCSMPTAVGGAYVQYLDGTLPVCPACDKRGVGVKVHRAVPVPIKGEPASVTLLRDREPVAPRVAPKKDVKK